MYSFIDEFVCYDEWPSFPAHKSQQNQLSIAAYYFDDNNNILYILYYQPVRIRMSYVF